MRRALFGLLALTALVASAFAQPGGAPGVPRGGFERRTVVLEANRLVVDGRAAPAPPSLDLSGFEGRYSFAGDPNATLEINGVRYRFDGGRLVLDTELRAAPDAVFALGSIVPAGARFGTRVAFDPGEAAAYATEQEWALERVAFDLAAQIRTTSPGIERAALVRRLRGHLLQTFDLKQDLRSRELAALEADLRTLRMGLRQRASQRDRIVQHRLVELVGAEALR